MIILDSITNENNKKHNEKWPYIPDHCYRILIIGGSRSGKTNGLLNLIKEQDDINKIYFYAKDLSEPKYEFFIIMRKDFGTDHLMVQMHLLSVQIEWMTIIRILMTTTQADKKNLIVFDDMITDIMSNKKLQAIIKKLFLRCRILNI